MIVPAPSGALPLGPPQPEWEGNYCPEHNGLVAPEITWSNVDPKAGEIVDFEHNMNVQAIENCGGIRWNVDILWDWGNGLDNDNTFQYILDDGDMVYAQPGIYEVNLKARAWVNCTTGPMRGLCVTPWHSDTALIAIGKIA